MHSWKVHIDIVFEDPIFFFVDDLIFLRKLILFQFFVSSTDHKTENIYIIHIEDRTKKSRIKIFLNVFDKNDLIKQAKDTIKKKQTKNDIRHEQQKW